MKFSGGRYKGVDYSEVYQKDRGYFEFMMEKSRLDMDHPQWGEKNAQQYNYMLSIIKSNGGTVPEPGKPVDNGIVEAQKGKERLEMMERVSNCSMADIYNKAKEIELVAKKLDALSIKLDELYNEVATVKWFVSKGEIGQAESKSAKDSEPDAKVYMPDDGWGCVPKAEKTKKPSSPASIDWEE